MKLKLPVFFLAFGVLFVLVAGCISPVQPSPPATVTGTLTPTPTTPVPTTLPTIPAPSTTVFTRDQVGQLFIDIAFGCDNTWITKINPTAENHLFFSLEGSATAEDRVIVEQFARQYNLMTATETFTDDPLSDKGAPIVFFPGKSLDSLEKTFIGCREIDPTTGTVLSLIYKPIIENPGGETVMTTRIYINADLEGARRQHYLQRAMLYYLGFPGETYAYPDSFFYYNTSESVSFTPLDIEAMKTMQNPGVYNGMGITEARWLLLDN
jgi:hypothetical protein